MRILRPFAVIVFLAVAAWPQPLAGGIDDIAIDAEGNILAAVGELHQVFRVTPNGTVSVFAGTGGQRDFLDPGGDGGPAVAAVLREPYGVTVDPRTNEVYIADSIRVRKVDINGIITTVVGNGNWGDGIAGGELASEFALGHLLRVEFDPGSGKLYIAQNDGRIWRVEAGRIYHHAGSGEDGCGSDAGPAVEAQFGFLIDLVVNSEGAVYLADYGDYRIHEVDPNGSTITGAVGNWRFWPGLIPDGTAALRTGMRRPLGLALDSDNLLHFVGDDGLIYRLERNGTLTLFSDLYELLDGPAGRMVFDQAGNLILGDDRNFRIFEVSADGRQTRILADLESAATSARTSAVNAKAELFEPRHIIGGREVAPGEWPFVVRVELDRYGGGLDSTCTGSLVAPNWVLTSAHCLVDDEGIADEPGDISVFLGYDWDKGVCENIREEIGRVIIHPDYDHRPKGSIPDAALVEILEPAPAAPIKLLTPGEEALYAPAGASVTVIGGGRQNDGNYARILRQVELILWSTEDCREDSLWESWERGVINESALCVGRVEGKKTGIGDSGGPHVVPLPGGRWGQVGVHTLGGGPGRSIFDYPSVLTRAAAIRDWVYEQTGGDPYALPSAVERVGGIVSGLLTKEGVKNAASFAPGAAPESIVSLFGTPLARETAAAHGRPLPLRQAGIAIEIIDSSETAYQAKLFYAGREQVNFLMPSEAATGEAVLRLTREGEEPVELALTIDAVAPGLFSVNGTGEGIGAISALRVATDGSRSNPKVFRYDAAAGRVVGVPLDLGIEGGHVFLTLFGTGIREAGGAETVQATIGGSEVPVVSAGAQSGWAGLDQVEVGPLPRSLAGSGEVKVAVTAAGVTSNTVTIVIE